MTDQEAREFLERLAVPERTLPPACPLCGGKHQLEQRCTARVPVRGTTPKLTAV